jgi:hypothetical protein
MFFRRTPTPLGATPLYGMGEDYENAPDSRGGPVIPILTLTHDEHLASERENISNGYARKISVEQRTMDRLNTVRSNFNAAINRLRAQGDSASANAYESYARKNLDPKILKVENRIMSLKRAYLNSASYGQDSMRF